MFPIAACLTTASSMESPPAIPPGNRGVIIPDSQEKLTIETLFIARRKLF
jgi:hypothetical protein